MRAGVASVRLAISLLVLVAVIATYVDTASRTPVNPFNFFGFCTVQANLIAAVIIIGTAILGLAGGVALPWANTVVHVVLPIYCILDWVLVADRPRLPWKLLAWIVVYPLVWAVVVLVRGATDGWVPYPFLDPQLGYGTVVGYVAVLAVPGVGFGVAVLALSRVRVLRVRAGRFWQWTSTRR